MFSATPATLFQNPVMKQRIKDFEENDPLILIIGVHVDTMDAE